MELVVLAAVGLLVFASYLLLSMQLTTMTRQLNRRLAQQDAAIARIADTLGVARPEALMVQQVQSALAEGAKIRAIKIVRETTGVGLKEAKTMVERIERGEPQDAPG